MDLGSMHNILDNARLGKAFRKSDIPDPAEEYKTYSKDELIAFKQRAQIMGLLKVERILAGPLGFWMFTNWCSRQQDIHCKHVGLFLVDLTSMKLALGEKRKRARDNILKAYFPLKSDRIPKQPSYVSPEMVRKLRPPVPESAAKYADHVKVTILGDSRSSLMSRVSLSSGWPISRSRELIREDDPLTMFDVIEDLVIMYFEKVVMETWLNEESNPDFLEYMRYLKIQHDESLSLSMFSVFRNMGKGGFGLVKGCRTQTTGRMYALKEMDKKRVKKRKSKHLCDQECMVLKLIDSPFCINLKYAFQTPTSLVLIIDLMMGGDLRYHHHRKEKRFPEEWARYYGARTMLGLQALHDAGFIYRDLKPENILVADDGSTRLSDMGLAVRETPGLRGTAGTPGYCAPEMLLGKTYDRLVDWWSFGCFMYELCAHHSPFRTKDACGFNGIKEKHKAITAASCEMDIKWPASFSPDFLDLCQRLLTRDPNRRLGKQGGAAELMRHPFFKSLDWDMMKADGFASANAPEAPPLVPGKTLNIEDMAKIGDFAELGDEVQLEPADFPQDEWSFISQRAFQSEVVWLLQWRAETAGQPSATKSKACVIF
ncbi:hypothetical protein CTAYLR_009749 [Chrysophaeum taylorii]|uniref:Protein kinase domain-containing protein n=1 Tax=Chrysophaeum taylorii TaxID=2483200 RepID=A0AAD7XQ88_9STRA|nr:hypothetical protein CTAYLR_009749 [Chrysophaeum taylorii]